jgi:hypothetical protein
MKGLGIHALVTEFFLVHTVSGYSARNQFSVRNSMILEALVD